MTDREAMKMALEALEKYEDEWLDDGRRIYVDAELDALRQALAQPEQEPVAWLVSDAQGRYATIRDPAPYGEEVYEPLYAAPPKREWVGLTDEEIKGILDCGRGGLVDIKKAEQILKEKNGG